MRRRLDLAAALVHNPDILFLDEPTTGLDPVSRASVWAEVRRLNRELGMTIFLTTQYLEEADELADRVGIIDKGRIVAEGTPAELKRTVGTDVIVVRIDGDAAGVCPVVEKVPGVQSVEVRGPELVIATDSGPATVSPVAVALAGCEVGVRELTLRTPTLDDVFLDLTGTRIERDDDRGDEFDDGHDHATTTATTTRGPDVTTIAADPASGDALRARPAGLVHDVSAIAGRALRAVPRDLEAVIPPVFIAVFFFLVNIATLGNLTEQIPGLNYEAFQMADGDPAGRHRRLAGAGAGARRAGRLPRPAAAHAGQAHCDPARPHGRRRRGGRRAHAADHPHRVHPRRALRGRSARRGRVHRAGGAVEPGLRRVRVRHRPQDRQPGGGELELPAVLPLPVPDVVVRAARASSPAGSTRSPRSTR